MRIEQAPDDLSGCSPKQIAVWKEAELVPECFRVFPIELSVAARNMPQTVRFFGNGNSHATVLVRSPEAKEFQVVLQSEMCELDTNPSFVEKAWLPPLDMPNSQQIAQATLVRVELHSGRSFIGSAQTTLAALVWREAGPLSVTQRVGKLRHLSRIGSKDIAPEILLNVESFSHVDHSCRTGDEGFSLPPSPRVQFLTDVDRLLHAAAEAKAKQLSYTISRANRNGDWTVVYKSGRRSNRKNAFPPADILRDTLLGGETGRQIRLALHSFHRLEGSRLEGFLIFRLDEVDMIHRDGGGRAANIRWIHMHDYTLDAGIECSSVNISYDGAASLKFIFKHGEQVAAEQAAAAGEDSAALHRAPATPALSLRQAGSRVSSDERRSSCDGGSERMDTSMSASKEDEPSPWPRRSVGFSRAPRSADSSGTTISSSMDSRLSAGRVTRPSSLYVPGDPPKLTKKGVLSPRHRQSAPQMDVRFPGEER